MQGQRRCQEESKTSPVEWGDFESWFLREERHAQVAKRYAAKFCPEQIDIANATLARVTVRAQLAMEPRR